MKSAIILFFCLLVCFGTNAQIIENVDECFPFQGYFASVKKGNQWGFINRQGELVVKFRDDLVISKSSQNVCNSDFESTTHPVISDDRCLIKKLKNDVYYYGYINEKGIEVIEPQFLNASHFMNGFAIVVKLAKNEVGYNEVLKKNIIAYKLEEYIIDTNGNLYMILNNIRNYIPSKTKTAPEFHSKFIAPNLIAVQDKLGKWDIYDF